jgi:ribosomal protein L36
MVRDHTTRMQNVKSIDGVDERVKRAGKMRIYCADVQRK